ncbi:Xaa-Pro dipeptidase PepQ [hydrothermal vent metagenome]|uniref:Xaa-Pro dipeptidase PepQ n=1 Tax=hydrothermal vent metagenome TaxID=652676 RepID=A0A3B0VND8_9ZZZZ
MYSSHYKYVSEIINQALEKAKLDGVLIYAGHAKNYFLDDMPYAFACNPHFKWLVPITAIPYCLIHYSLSQKPVLYLYQPQDYWHSLPKTVEGDWAEFFEIIAITCKQDLPDFGNLKNHGWIGQDDSCEYDSLKCNPRVYMDYVHFHRACKTDYEIDNIKAANILALKGHNAAMQCFQKGYSEFESHMAYMLATKHNEHQLPYGNIIAQNTNAAVLHYQHMQRKRVPKGELKSFLIDAGCSVNGYVSDITRTYSYGDDDFSQMIVAVDHMQVEIGKKAVVGTSYIELHQQAHHLLAAILQDFDIISCDPQTANDTGLSNVFFPHGLGHYLGLQVHDIGGHQSDEDGNILVPPTLHRHLRLTRTLQKNNVVTIEPGIYFIDILLAQAKQTDMSKNINWSRVADFKPYGGIRIEDNIVVQTETPINLTRA